jgi:hypothetical protein
LAALYYFVPASLKQLSRHFANVFLQVHALADEASTFQSGVKHAGWLWKRFGHGHKTKWKRLWVGGSS